MKKNKPMIILFLTPAVLFFLVVFLYPILRTILMSLFHITSITDKIGDWEFTGLSNYINLFKTSLFLQSCWNLVPHMAVWRHYRIITFTVIRCYINERHPFQENVPCHYLSAEYCQCGSTCYDVVAVCIQPEIRPFKIYFHSTAFRQLS